jgi:hypothetical protein
MKFPTGFLLVCYHSLSDSFTVYDTANGKIYTNYSKSQEIIEHKLFSKFCVLVNDVMWLVPIREQEEV